MWLWTYTGSVLWIQIHFFSDSNLQIFFGFGYGVRSTRNWLKWCLSMLSYRYVFWNLYDRGKSFPTEKSTLFSLSNVWSANFSNSFYFTAMSVSEAGIRIQTFFRILIRPKLTDSFGFRFGSTTLIYRHSAH
jgi:hypothetical protein